ncbi:gliding motility-associated C-terminal domain-containing protein, partial [Winogradskyella eckloniae]|uniref:DUF7507 domain-containing protein n=1 Tax=Winogradskyella eckloniae TaxID=1089306 RepID=UPI001567627A
VSDDSDTDVDPNGNAIPNNETVDSPDGDGTDDMDPTNDPTVTLLTTNPEITITKTVNNVSSEGEIGYLDDVITYDIVVVNTGDVTITNIEITDPNADAGTITGSPIASLAPGESVTVTAEQTITQNDIDAGYIENSATGTGDSPDGTDDVSDVSDAGDESIETPDGDGSTDNDPTNDPTVTLLPDPSIEVVKTFEITNDVLPVGASLDDEITYTISVTNTGNVPLDNVAIVDTFTDLDGNILTFVTGPSFVSPSSLGSTEGLLLVGETATYTATYIIEQDVINVGGFTNSVVASGDSPDDISVSDTSDDGIDDDGNVEDDPTEIIITSDPKINLIKTILPLEDTNGDGIAGGVDDIINYVFIVENTGNVTLYDIVVEDNLPNLNLMGGPILELLPGAIDSTTFTATYLITQEDINIGTVTNSASVRGEQPGGDINDILDDIVDTSDDPNDNSDNDDNGDGEPDDPTIVILNSIFDLEVTKVVDEVQPLIGDLVTFTIEVANIGNVTATNIVIDEQIPSGYEIALDPNTGDPLIDFIPFAPDGSYSVVNGEWFINQLEPDEVGILRITVEVLGFGDYLNTAYIQSAVGGVDEDLSNNEDDATVNPICLTIYNEFSPDGDGINETFVIDCIERFPENKLEVYNRWGNIVYTANGYLNDWTGISNGRAVINQSDELPVGTYYYVLDLGDGSDPRVGWLYINRKN